MMQKPLILAVETSGRMGSVAIAIGKKMLAEKIFSRSIRHSSQIFPAIASLLETFSRKPKEIDHVYISIGPGSFTGLRIAVALAKTMHLANAAKIVAVDTLDVIAANASDYIQKKTPLTCHSEQSEESLDKIAAILDAKRGQFFIAAYNLHPSQTNNTKDATRNTIALRKESPGLPQVYDIRYTKYEKILPDCLMTSSQFLELLAKKEKPTWLLGEGLVYYKDAFKAETVRFLPEDYWSPRAANVHLLGYKKAAAGQFADPLTLQPTYLRRPQAEEKWQPPKPGSER